MTPEEQKQVDDLRWALNNAVSFFVAGIRPDPKIVDEYLKILDSSSSIASPVE